MQRRPHRICSSDQSKKDESKSVMVLVLVLVLVPLVWCWVSRRLFSPGLSDLAASTVAADTELLVVLSGDWTTLGLLCDGVVLLAAVHSTLFVACGNCLASDVTTVCFRGSVSDHNLTHLVTACGAPMPSAETSASPTMTELIAWLLPKAWCVL